MRAEPCEAHPKTLEAMRDCYRPLLIFAASGTDVKLRSQLTELRSHAAALRERDVMIIVATADGSAMAAEGLPATSMGRDEAAAARKRFGLDDKDFSVLLIGKDGGEKLRTEGVLAASRLNEKIDGMPMRQSEMGKK